MKKIISVLLALTLILTLFAFAGCNDNSGSKDNDINKTTSDDAAKKDTLILGLDDSFPPMGFRNDKNEIVGFDIDLATEVAKRLNKELVLKPIDWDSKEMELNAKNIDCIWNGMSYSDERNENMKLSFSYLQNEMVLVVLNDSEFKNQEDLKDKKIAVQSGSTAEEILEASDFAKTIKEVVPFAENQTAFMDLDAKGVDAVFLDSVVANYYIVEQNKDYVVLSDFIEKEEYVIGFRKADTALCADVENALKAMRADGTITKIAEKWFGNDKGVLIKAD